MTSNTQIKTVALSALNHDDAANVRKSNRDADFAELKASIAAHGVVQSLRVRPGDGKTFLVIAGNRRLAALKELQADGVLPADFAAPVIIGKDDDAQARELSLVENVERLPLTPVDEFRAYARLNADGAAASDIAARFGVPVRRVQQRLSLAALHGDVIAALECGEISLETAQAFTVQKDTERQRKWLNDNLQTRWNLNANAVRRAMTDEHLRADAPLAKLLTEAAYCSAGGEITDDLFGENRYWISADVIETLTQAHWADQVAAWLADGWAWAAPESEYGDAVWSLRSLHAVRPEPSKKDQKRLDAIADQLEALYEADDDDTEADAAIDRLEAEQIEIRERYMVGAFTAEQKACSGVVYSEAGGNHHFAVLDADKADIPAEIDPAPVKAKPVEKVEASDPLAISAALSQDLSLMLAAAARRAVEASPDLAMSLLAATLFQQLAHKRGASTITARAASGVDLRFDDEGFAVAVERYQAMTPKQRTKALASLFAATLDVSDHFTGYSGDRDARAALLDAVAPDAVPDFDAGRYFGGVNKAQILVAYAEMTGGGKLNDAKKAEMADAAAAKAAETGWLPVQLRSAAYAGPNVVKLAKAA